MTPDQFRACLRTAGLSQLGFARLIGVNGRTVRRYAAADGEGLPPPVARLAWLVARHGPGILDGYE